MLLSFVPIKVRLLQSIIFPTFITQFPTTEITIQTNDVSLAGIYLFKIIARDTLNDLENDTVRFKLTLTCTSTGIKAIYDAKTIT